MLQYVVSKNEVNLVMHESILKMSSLIWDLSKNTL